ncbi:putative transcription factor bZIP family [Helianthus annuus]|nr:putative transcription factor bZIP family [Helianthus annuus]KAJ0458944.1 putative transcription factor bZIP family [Helianthus annuus]KAJ0639485.1 putative transcription factor bZIP family [Helianthus annuus]KAJ0643471.1 putative transcription factor bZIP family [Helianthus annuus]KAJ0819565.1 putative transcription factor bZIP family [Helianthus annuus]
MSPVLSEIFRSGLTINSSLRRRTHLVQSLSIPNSGSEEDLMDQRKRKRMQSNRESARRSRMRKQKHLDDLTDQINQMKKDNAQILTTINVTTQQLVHVEADNSVLRAQMSELSQRLDYLNEINNLMGNTNNSGVTGMMYEYENHHDFINSPWNMMYINQQPIMAAAAEMLQY